MRATGWPRERSERCGSRSPSASLVCDPEALVGYARKRYAASWFDSEWKPADLAEAVLEALVISNENPSAGDYGIEILESQASEEPAGT